MTITKFDLEIKIMIRLCQLIIRPVQETYTESRKWNSKLTYEFSTKLIFFLVSYLLLILLIKVHKKISLSF